MFSRNRTRKKNKLDYEICSINNIIKTKMDEIDTLNNTIKSKNDELENLKIKINTQSKLLKNKNDETYTLAVQIRQKKTTLSNHQYELQKKINKYNNLDKTIKNSLQTIKSHTKAIENIKKLLETNKSTDDITFINKLNKDKFVIDIEKIKEHNNMFFNTLISDSFSDERNDEGYYELDCYTKTFDCLIKYLKYDVKKFYVDSEDFDIVKKQFDFFLIEDYELINNQQLIKNIIKTTNTSVYKKFPNPKNRSCEINVYIDGYTILTIDIYNDSYNPYTFTKLTKCLDYFKYPNDSDFMSTDIYNRPSTEISRYRERYSLEVGHLLPNVEHRKSNIEPQILAKYFNKIIFGDITTIYVKESITIETRLVLEHFVKVVIISN